MQNTCKINGKSIIFEFWDPRVTPGRFCRLCRAGMDIPEPYSSITESCSVFGLRKTCFFAPAGAHSCKSFLVRAIAYTLRRLSILLENHEFRGSGAPWPPADGSVGSRGSAGTFLASTNRLPRRSAPCSVQKRDF